MKEYLVDHEIRSLVVIVVPSNNPFSLPTRLTLLVATFIAIICCTMLSSSASKKFANFFASRLVYSFKKLLSVGTGA